MKIRLNKFLASCGLGSRRKSEEFILKGQISVNRIIATKLSIVVDPEKDTVELLNRKLIPPKEHIYLILNKPRGFITTLMDEKKRPAIMDIIPEKYRAQSVFPVGRLDKETEGLLLITNDGDLAYRLSHPKYKIPKEYLVEIDRPLSDNDREKIVKGIYLHQIKAKTGHAAVTAIDAEKKRIKFVISEGKKRQVRLTFQNLGYKVISLIRTGYGPIKISGLKKGHCRPLKKDEIKALKGSVKP